MKKVLSLLLCVLLVISAVPVVAWAEETDIESAPIGTMTGETVDGVTSTSLFTDDFSEDSERDTAAHVRKRKGVGVNAVYASGSVSTVIDYGLSSSLENANPVDEHSGLYHFIRCLSTYTERTGPAYLYQFKIGNLGQSEKLHISLSANNEDTVFAKNIMFTFSNKPLQNGNRYLDMVVFNTDKTIGFYGSDEKITYVPGKWYDVDIVFNYDNVATSGAEIISGVGDINYYINKNLVAVAEDIDFYNIFSYAADADKGLFHRFGWGIKNYGVDLTADSGARADSVFAVDNLRVEILSADKETGLVPYGSIKNTSSESVYSYTDDYTDTIGSSYFSNVRKNQTLYSAYGSGSPSKQSKFTQTTDDSGNCYVSLIQEKDMISYGNPAIDYIMNITDLAQDEKIHISIDLKNDDLIFEKKFFLSRHQKTLGSSGRDKTLVNFGTDGLLTFYGVSGLEIPYTLGQWYHFDVVINYENVSTSGSEIISGEGTISYYVDGVYVGTSSTQDFYNDYKREKDDSTRDFFQRIGFGIYTPGYTTARENDSVFSADNFTVRILAASAKPLINIPAANYELSNFAVTPFTIGESGTVTASATLTNTDHTKKVTFVIATYNANNELTGVKVGPTHVLSGNISLSADVEATDSCVKVLVVDNASNITPIQSATVISAQSN